jgi:ferredoxin
MIRDIVKIDENLCDGCGLCIPNCHEGALQIIDGKARLISDLMCDGLGACLGHCPKNAITIEKREAKPYDEIEVIKDIIPKGKNVLTAHLKHLKEHNEHEFFLQAMTYLEEIKDTLSFDINEVKAGIQKTLNGSGCTTNCPGSAEKVIKPVTTNNYNEVEASSALSHWPIQMHLINPASAHFKNSDIVFAADCVAFSLGNFHSKFLKGKTLAIMCPKLDHNQNIYIDKIVSLINDAQINTITVITMEVPCCWGLLKFVKEALSKTDRKVPVKSVVISLSGEILKEEWI